MDIEAVKGRWHEMLEHLADAEVGAGKRLDPKAALPVAVEAGALFVLAADEHTAATLEDYAEDLLHPLFGPSATYAQTKPSFTRVRALVTPEWGMVLARALL